MDTLTEALRIVRRGKSDVPEEIGIEDDGGFWMLGGVQTTGVGLEVVVVRISEGGGSKGSESVSCVCGSVEDDVGEKG